MSIKELLIKEIDTLPQETIYLVYQFVQFQKYLMDDTTYLESIPGMKESIIEGMKEDPDKCIIYTEDIWQDG